MTEKELIKKIKELKTEKNAVILVHNYQKPEIFKIADFIGDSLDLCKKAMNTDAKIILFCGVKFMAESAAILNPNKKVIVPFLDAGCAMADMIKVSDIKKLKQEHPNAAVMCYVNSNAEIKAVSDVCCTSANALKVAKNLQEKEIIFVPDKNLALYVQKMIPEKKIITFEGFCPVHHYLNSDTIKTAQSLFPNAKIIAHPECQSDVLAMSDMISNTTGMIDKAKESKANEFFIVTECGMIERLKQEIPNKKFYGVCNLCFDMKKTTLESVYNCLLSEKPVVKIEPNIAKNAKHAFDRMFELM